MNTPPNGQPSPKTSALAIWSLVLGILSLCCCTIFAGIPGVICGHKAQTRIKNSNGTLTGQGLAIAGLVTGYIGIVMSLFMIPLLLAIAIPNFVKARQAAQVNGCINNLRMIDAAKQQWALEKGKQSTDLPAESDLTPYLPKTLPKCPAGGEYRLNIVSEHPSCSVPGHKIN